MVPPTSDERADLIHKVFTGLAVGIAHLAKLRAEGSIVVLTHDVVEA